MLFSNQELAVEQFYELDWKLKKEKNGIQVFTRDLINSNLKEVKIIMSIRKTTMPKIIELLNQSDLYQKWMYKCSESRMVEEKNELESVSYYKFDFPWPLSDREAYLKSVIRKDEYKNRWIVTTTSVTGYGEEKDDIVLMKDHFNQWEFHEKENNQIDLIYYLKTNPGGNIPDWLVNLAVDKGPTNSLGNFRSILEQ